MAAADRRRGRRDNGLAATDWRAIEDLDPRVSEPVLDLLAAQGIAAYVQPAVDVDPVTRGATLPARPHDRLFVDRRALPAARETLRRFLRTGSQAEPAGSPDPAPPRGQAEPAGSPVLGPDSAHPRGPDPDGDAIDAAFADIVSRLDPIRADPTADTIFDATGAADDPRPGTGARGGGIATADPADIPDEEPDRAGDPPPAAVPARTGPVDGRHVTEPSLLDALDTFGADLPDLPEDQASERFEPPPPPPLPRLSRQTVLGALAIVVGLVLVIGQPGFVPFDRSTTMLLGFATMLGGATALILRLRPGDDPDDRPTGDGAQV